MVCSIEQHWTDVRAFLIRLHRIGVLPLASAAVPFDAAVARVLRASPPCAAENQLYGDPAADKASKTSSAPATV